MTFAVALMLPGSIASGAEVPAIVVVDANRPVAVGKFESRAPIHTNRDYVYGNIPKAIRGLQYTLHEHRNAATLSCRAKSDGVVYLCLEGDASPAALKLKGTWRQTGMRIDSVGHKGHWTVYAKGVKAGEKIAIPSPTKWGSVLLAGRIEGLRERGTRKVTASGRSKLANSNDVQSICETLHLEHPSQGFVSTTPVERWEDGLIVGSGTTGLLVSGTTGRQSYSIGHEWLFEPRTPPRELLPLGEHMDRCRQLALEGKGEEAVLLACGLGKERGFPRILWTNAMVPAGSLQVWMDGDAQVQQSARMVDWQRGEATTAWKGDAGLFHSSCFASRPDNLLVLRLRSPTGDRINAKLKLARPIDPDKVAEDRTDDTAAGNDWLTLVKDYRLKKPWRGAVRGYAIAARLVQRGGTAQVEDGWTHIRDADELVILMRIELYKDEPFDPTGTDRLRAELARIAVDYETLLNRHAEVHGEMFDRVKLKLGGETKQALSSEECIAGSRVGRTDPKLVEKLFNAARYAVISSTGELPPTLQGIWSGTFRPAWSSDFTQDGNVQAVIDSGLNGNFFEVTRAYLDYMTSLQEAFRRNARALYNCRGIWVPSRSSDYGDVQHFSDTWPGLFWFAGAAWVSAYYYDYWLYTDDRTFLKEQALPFMLDSAAYYEDFLSVERDGKIVFVPSFSPEISPKGRHGVTVNATMDVASVKQLLRNLIAIDHTGTVTLDPGRVARWKAMLGKMPDYEIDAEGAFKEWLWPGLNNNDMHRHASHMYPAWFEVDPAIRNSADLRAAVAKAIDNRLTYRRGKGGAEMAFGLVQKGIAAAHIRDEGLAYECVEWMVNSYWTTALCSTHNPGRRFNVDISGGMPGVIIEMLMQSRAVPAKGSWGYEIDLLPVLPGQWPEGSVTGLRARGGFEVDLTWKDGRLERAELTSKNDNTCKIRYNGRAVQFKTRAGKTYAFDRDLKQP